MSIVFFMFMPSTYIRRQETRFADVAPRLLYLNVLSVQVSLSVDNDPTVARIVKGRLEKTTLGHIAKDVKVVFTPGQAFISIVLDVKVRTGFMGAMGLFGLG